MRYLLDTHTLLWFLFEPTKLSNKAAKILTNEEHEILVSIVSYWEITLKCSLKKLELPEGWQSLLQNEIKSNSIEWLQVQAGHCDYLVDLEWIHRDPFDRMLISQVICENASLISKDSEIHKYPIPVVWN